MLIGGALLVLGILFGFLLMLLMGDPLARVRPLWIILCFLWGCTGAVGIAYVVNTWLGVELVSAASNMEELGTVDWKVAVLVAPLVEEFAKALPLFLMLIFARSWLERTTNGVLLGMACGLGFTVLEDAVYMLRGEEAEGTAGMMLMLVLRTVTGGYSHMVFTAATGWGAARAARGKWPLLAVGYGCAVLGHAFHNRFIGVAGLCSLFAVRMVFIGGLIFWKRVMAAELETARQALLRGLQAWGSRVGWTWDETEVLGNPATWNANLRGAGKDRENLSEYFSLLQECFLEQWAPDEAQLRRLSTGRIVLRRALGLSGAAPPAGP